MNFNEYQTNIIEFDTFKNQSGELNNPAFLAKILGLSGETGEVAEKFKKILRDDNGKITPEKRNELAKELGDVLWYLATISRYLNIPFEEIAITNIEKLSSRLDHNTLHGSGDNR